MGSSFFFGGSIMRYHYEKPKLFVSLYGELYFCDHPVYSRCTLYRSEEKGLAVIQQRYSPISKQTWWTEIDPWIANDIYLNIGFREYFNYQAGFPEGDIFPTVTVRQIMWALKMKPIPKERWETVFDRRLI